MKRKRGRVPEEGSKSADSQESTEVPTGKLEEESCSNCAAEFPVDELIDGLCGFCYEEDRRGHDAQLNWQNNEQLRKEYNHSYSDYMADNT